MGKRRLLVIGAIVVVAVAVVIAGVIGLQSGIVDDIAGHRSAGPSVTASPSAEPSESAVPSGPPTPDPTLPAVLKPATAPAATDADKLADRIATAGKSGGKASAAVLSVKSGTMLYKSGATTAMIPASTNKVLTSAAALDLLGPEHRFSTKVVSNKPLPTPTPSSSASGSARPSSNASPSGSGTPDDHPDDESTAAKKAGSIVLVGGGDPYLTGTRKDATAVGQASLESLAAGTAERLRRAGVGTVQLGYDATLFGGPAWNPQWPDGYGDVVTSTSALWVDEGRLSGSIGPRQDDPAKSAAEAFSAQLKKKGIKVSKITESKAGGKAQQVAAVPSLSLERIVEKLLLASDNDAAEVLLRQVGVATGQDGTIDDGTAGVHKTLAGLHAWVSSTHTVDGSGLSRDNKVSADALVKILQLAASGDEPKLGALLTGMPVAGVEGSLRYRLGSDDATAGRGLVRAKTGTLRKVHSLAGYTYTRDGELLVYAFLVNNPKNEWDAVVWLDKVSAAVATCGCKR